MDTGRVRSSKARWAVSRLTLRSEDKENADPSTPLDPLLPGMREAWKRTLNLLAIANFNMNMYRRGYKSNNCSWISVTQDKSSDAFW